MKKIAQLREESAKFEIKKIDLESEKTHLESDKQLLETENKRLLRNLKLNNEEISKLKTELEDKMAENKKLTKSSKSDIVVRYDKLLKENNKLKDDIEKMTSKTKYYDKLQESYKKNKEELLKIKSDFEKSEQMVKDRAEAVRQISRETSRLEGEREFFRSRSRDLYEELNRYQRNVQSRESLTKILGNTASSILSKLGDYVMNIGSLKLSKNEKEKLLESVKKTNDYFDEMNYRKPKIDLEGVRRLIDFGEETKEPKIGGQRRTQVPPKVPANDSVTIQMIGAANQALDVIQRSQKKSSNIISRKREDSPPAVSSFQVEEEAKGPEIRQLNFANNRERGVTQNSRSQNPRLLEPPPAQPQPQTENLRDFVDQSNYNPFEKRPRTYNMADLIEYLERAYDQRSNPPNTFGRRYALLRAIEKGELERFVTPVERTRYDNFIRNTLQNYISWMVNHTQLGDRRSQTNMIQNQINQIARATRSKKNI